MSIEQEQIVLWLRDKTDDPVEHFIGAFASYIPDWTDRHDVYLGKACALSAFVR